MTDAVVQAGVEAMAKGSQSFALAARLFDRDTREAALLLYNWCRLCDDLVDGQSAGCPVGPFSREGTALDRLLAFEQATEAVLAGRPATHPAFIGLGRTLERHQIPAGYLFAHLDGFRMDARGRTYRTVEDLLDYCYHVAGVVGLMMAHVMGVRDPATLDRACDLGIAFQLTNIARDIVPDAEVGRIYLPAAWLGDLGLRRGALADPASRPALAEAAARLVDLADHYYASALAGTARLPRRSAWAVRTAHATYRQIGLDVKRHGPRAWDRRVAVSRARQMTFMACAALRAAFEVKPRAEATPAGDARPSFLWRRPQ